MFNPTRLVAVLTLLSVVAVAQQPQFTYLRFNEDLGNLTWNDAAMASNNATLGGTASFGFQRLGCSSLVAGMTSSSRCETGRSINFTGDFTIECWVRYSSTSTSTGAIYAFGSSTTGSFRCFRGGAAGVDGLLLRLPNGGDTTITGVTADTWHHVAWTYDESALEVTPFLNGVAQPAQPVTAAIDLSTWLTSTLCVGGHTSSNSWDGQIDEFRFWTEERSASEIMNLMLREIDPNVVMRLNGQVPCRAASTISVRSPYELTIDVDGNYSNQPFALIAGSALVNNLIPLPFGGSIDVNGAYAVIDGISPTSALDLTAVTDWSASISFSQAVAGTTGPSLQVLYLEPSNVPFPFEITSAGRVFFSDANETVYDIGDDAFATHVLSSAIDFAGSSRTQMFIGANAQITFGAGSTDFTPSTAEFFNGFGSAGNEGVAALWADYNRSTGPNAQIVVSEINSSKVQVTWENQQHWTSQLPAGTWSVTFEENLSASGDDLVSFDLSQYQPRVIGADQDPLLGVTDGVTGGTDTVLNLSAQGGRVTAAGAAPESICEIWDGSIVGATTTMDVTQVDFISIGVHNWILSVQ